MRESQLLQVNHVSHPQREEGRSGRLTAAASRRLRGSKAFVKLQALIYVSLVENGKRIPGCFHNASIKQKLNQETDGIAMWWKADRSIFFFFFITVKNLTHPA